MTKKELKEDDLKQVNGGWLIIGDQDIKFCDHCQKNTKQTLIDTNVNVNRFFGNDDCDIWKCEECQNTNYYVITTGELIVF